MIFGSLGLLVVSSVLLAFGIGKASVGMLVLALVSACAAGLMLVAAYQAHRARLAVEGGAPAPAPVGAPIAGIPAGAQAVYFVPVTPAGQPLAMASPPAAAGNGGTTVVAEEAPPLVGYDAMTATQIARLIGSGALTDEQIDAITRYEASHQRRKTVLQAGDDARP